MLSTLQKDVLYWQSTNGKACTQFSVTDAQFALEPPHALSQCNFFKNIEACTDGKSFKKKKK